MMKNKLKLALLFLAGVLFQLAGQPLAEVTPNTLPLGATISWDVDSKFDIPFEITNLSSFPNYKTRLI